MLSNLLYLKSIEILFLNLKIILSVAYTDFLKSPYISEYAAKGNIL